MATDDAFQYKSSKHISYQCTNDTLSMQALHRTLSLGTYMVNDSPLGALSHWLLVYGRHIKKDRQHLILMTPGPDHCHLVAIWLMTLPWVPCHTCCLFMVDTLKKHKQNLTLMTLDPEPCQYVYGYMTFSWAPPHTDCLFVVNKLKKRQAKPHPNDCLS